MSSELPKDHPSADEWTRKAADEISQKFGLSNSDQAPNGCAKIIARHFQNHLTHEKVLSGKAVLQKDQITLAAAEIADAMAEESRRDLDQPSRMDMELAVENLAKSERGLAVMLGLLKLLDDHALGLDYKGQNAVITLLRSAWGPFAGSARDCMRDTLDVNSNQ